MKLWHIETSNSSNGDTIVFHQQNPKTPLKCPEFPCIPTLPYFVKMKIKGSAHQFCKAHRGKELISDFLIFGHVKGVFPVAKGKQQTNKQSLFAVRKTQKHQPQHVDVGEPIEVQYHHP